MFAKALLDRFLSTINNKVNPPSNIIIGLTRTDGDDSANIELS